jgi:nifR3 family TIM-barrel protein
MTTAPALAAAGAPTPLPALRIGAVPVDFPVALAPMAGYTDAAFRSLCVEMGAGLTLTELANASGLCRESARTFHLLETAPGEHPVGAHLYGSEPDVMARAAAEAERLGRFDFVDINAGCPVRKIVSRGAGVALLREPRRLEAIVRAMRAATSLPVTAKTRVGLEAGGAEVRDAAAALEQGGASALFLHARFAADKHSGPARWDLLARVKAGSAIPVVGNGGIETVADIREMLAATGVDGVMIGRAALGNPWLFAEARAALGGRSFQPPSAEDRRRLVREHLRRAIALTEKAHRAIRRPRHSAEKAAVMQFRPHLLRYVSGTAGTGLVRRRLDTLFTAADVDGVLNLVFG